MGDPMGSIEAARRGGKLKIKSRISPVPPARLARIGEAKNAD
jgi:hypothetical protein